MNIKVQLCGIALIVLIAIIFESQRKLKLKSTLVFRASLYACLSCLVLDILSLVGIYYHFSEGFPEFWTKFICKSYLVSLIAVGLLAQIYISSTVAVHLSYYKKLTWANGIFALVIAVLVYALPINIGISATDSSLTWTEGPSCYVTYGGMFVLIVTTLVQIFRQKKHLYPRQRRTVIAWMFMWLVAAVIQVVFNEFLSVGVLIVGFAGALGVALVYFQFENPELNLDKGTRLFNYSAYSRYGEQMYGGYAKFYTIAVKLESTVWRSERDKIRNTYDEFLEIHGASVFRVLEKEILLFFSKQEEAKAAWELLKSKVAEDSESGIQRFNALFYVEDPRFVSSHRELLELIRYYEFQKKDGKAGSAYIIDSSVVFHMLSERKMGQKILEALEEDRVVVYYQPIYSVEKKKFTTAEALVRIIDKDGKLIPPNSFISIAESNGMIIEIGRRVFEKVCQFFKKNQLETLGIEYVEVNLSVVQCADGKLADDYIKILQRYEMDPKRINLEITESASLHAKQMLISNMERLIKHGIHFSLDDFGTGASNLNYIVDMPVKIVKFDRGMTQAYFESGKARYVMEAAVHMIQGMGLAMVAEGVETAEQNRKMEEINMDFIQGYYYSKPLPEQEFLEFLRRENSN